MVKSQAQTAPGDAYAPIVVQENHYDPWGLGLPLNADAEKVAGSPEDRFTYNGKEKQQSVGWFDYGARMYDPQTGRWITIDSKGEKCPNLSPFNYVENKPTVAIDPDGNEIVFVVRGKNGANDRTLTYRNGSARWNDTRKQYNGRGANNTIFRVIQAYKKIEGAGDKVLKGQLKALETSELIIGL